jgi:hypothetical protein
MRTYAQHGSAYKLNSSFIDLRYDDLQCMYFKCTYTKILFNITCYQTKSIAKIFAIKKYMFRTGLPDFS